MTLALRDDLFDAQFVRALAYTGQGGADIGECFGTDARITKTDADLWHDEWLATAQRVERQAPSAKRTRARLEAIASARAGRTSAPPTTTARRASS